MSAERGAVVAHPLDGKDDVAHAEVAGVGIFFGAEFAQVSEAKNIDAMVERDHDHVVFAREICAVKRNLTARGIAISAAVQPNHDGAFVAHAKSRGPDVKDQAVFAASLIPLATPTFENDRRRGL